MTKDNGVPPSGEEWRNAPGFGPYYIVSSLGRVRNVDTGKLLFGDRDPKGYRRVNLRGKHRRVARLVCEAFHGPCPEGLECAHVDGNHRNDAAANLAWVTRSENTKHSIAHGTYKRPVPPKGEKHPHAKLSKEQVIEIRRLAEHGHSRRELARQFGVGATQIHRIITGEKWHV